MNVFPSNCPELVGDLLNALGFSGDEEVTGTNGTAKPIRQALTRDYQITKPTAKFLKDLIVRSDAAPLIAELLAPERRPELEAYLWGLEIIDFIQQHPSAKYTPVEFVGALGKLLPRLYSISSSQKLHPDQVHFTIDVVRYESHGRQRKGVSSTFLADRANPEPVFIFPNPSKFKLPADGNTPLIMVGPGTGVAPFRAFLQERKAIGAKGRNWLFFGAQRRALDFFYQEELEAMRAEGFLTRLDLAFSRDQAEKIYVQTRMKENAAELWKWLEEGAAFYVCGDARRMAKDVDAALHTVIEEAGGLDPEAARAYVESLKKQGRYNRDVY
jgi:sulfite reductase (NADPH) flavoprotein alpha-component